MTKYEVGDYCYWRSGKRAGKVIALDSNIVLADYAPSHWGEAYLSTAFIRRSCFLEYTLLWSDPDAPKSESK